MRADDGNRFVARAASPRGREQQNVRRRTLYFVKGVFGGIGRSERETRVGQELAKRITAGVGRADQEEAGSFCGQELGVYPSRRGDSRQLVAPWPLDARARHLAPFLSAIPTRLASDPMSFCHSCRCREHPRWQKRLKSPGASPKKRSRISSRPIGAAVARGRRRLDG